MRTVSAIAAVVTPRSAALALSGRITISGRCKLAVDLMLPMPGTVRSSRSMSRPTVLSAIPSSDASATINFSPAPPWPTPISVPGSTFNASRNCDSISCLLALRSERSVSLISKVAFRDSEAPPPANGSLPALPAPIAV